MASDFVMIPFSRELYADIVRLSDGQLDPADLAHSTVMTWMEALSFDEGAWGEGGDRWEEAARKYAPHLLEERQRRLEEIVSHSRAKNKPLEWGIVSVPTGSEIRMSYKRTSHYAVVQNGRIADADGDFSPNEWAAKVTGGARNAWRDLWFKLPLSDSWVSAETLRQRARDQQRTGR